MQHGCIPVKVDLYRRYPSDFEVPSTNPAYPFASLISWERVVVEATADRLDGLLDRLLHLERSAASRRRYMRSIAHWISYDAHDAHGQLRLQDAPSAAMHELAARLQT